ncbi:hypothetical protein JB92DRAFT_2836019 [Gautieria morchelliformis]|nr:hypothetical protein JB92DRAFT_2836019 [Gautieria morchelliformis]
MDLANRVGDSGVDCSRSRERFNRWTQKVPLIDGAETIEKNTDEKSQLSSILFLSGRSRIVRRLHAVSDAPPAHHNPTSRVTSPTYFRYIVVETLGAINSGKGKVFTREKCELIPGRDDSEMRLKVEGNATFWIGLKGAQVEGNTVPEASSVVREKLLQSFGQGKGVGRWRSGPIVEDRS